MLAQLAKIGMDIGAGIMGYDESEDARERGKYAAALAAQQQEEGIQRGIDNRRAGTAQSLGYLQPYEETGRSGMKLLSDALGINGPEAQKSYFSGFQNDPGFLATQKAGTDAIEQSAAGGGMLRSGGTLKGLMDYGQKGMFAQISDRLNRLTTSGQQGQNAASGMAGINESSAAAISNYLRDIGITKAGGTINANNQDQAGTQNMLSVLGNTAGRVGQGVSDLIGQFSNMIPGMGGSGGGGVLPGGTPLGLGGIGSR
jgi:hypothetical protein